MTCALCGGTRIVHMAPSTCSIGGPQPCTNCAGIPVLFAGPVTSHSDDVAVDRFAALMKAKLYAARAKGRGGWDDPAQCSPSVLSEMLHDHVAKGDPVDVANFAMMIEHYGAPISPATGGTFADGVKAEDDEPAPWAVAAERAASDAYASYMGDPDGDDGHDARIAAAKAIEEHAIRALQPGAGPVR